MPLERRNRDFAPLGLVMNGWSPYFEWFLGRVIGHVSAELSLRTLREKGATSPVRAISGTTQGKGSGTLPGGERPVKWGGARAVAVTDKQASKTLRRRDCGACILADSDCGFRISDWGKLSLQMCLMM